MKYSWISVITAILVLTLMQKWDRLAELTNANTILIFVFVVVIISLFYVVNTKAKLINWSRFTASNDKANGSDEVSREEDIPRERSASKLFSKELEAMLHKSLNSATQQRHAEATSNHLARTILEEPALRSLLSELQYKVDNVIQKLRKKESETQSITDGDAVPNESFQRIVQVAVLRSESDVVTVWDAFYALISEASENDRALLLILRSGFSRSERKNRSAQPKSSVEKKQWYEVLDVSEQATKVEIRAAYRRVIALYHPDRVSGLGKELVELANRRAYEINEAYETVRRLKG